MLRIVKDNATSLHSKCKEVEMPVPDEDVELLKEMRQYLLDSQDEAFREKHPKVREGVGLAAPQVGANKRMLVISYAIDDKGNRVEHALVNPVLISNSVKLAYLAGGEGCLSVDKPHPGYVYRYYKVTVKAYDALLGKEVTLTKRGYDAIVLQHEMDHLDGILFYDHIDKKEPFKKIPGAVEI
jgi:peptide deformylase